MRGWLGRNRLIISLIYRRAGDFLPIEALLRHRDVDEVPDVVGNKPLAEQLKLQRFTNSQEYTAECISTVIP